MRSLLLLALLLPLLHGATALPVLPTGTVEVHGTWSGEPYWARLHAAEHGKPARLLELEWTPPDPAVLGGVRLVDCPLLLLDEHARLVAWNGRDSLSQARLGTPDGYEIDREIASSNPETPPQARHRILHGPRLWDLHLAPLLLALCWRADAAAEIQVYDLFGAQADPHLTVTWHGSDGQIAGEAVRIVAQGDHCARLLDAAHGDALLTVDAWTRSP